MATRLQQADVADSRKKPRTGSRRATTDEQMVAQKLRYNFKSMSSDDFDSVVRDGLTLRGRLLKDYKSWKETKSPTMGPAYYRQLRQVYGNPAPDNSDPLKPTDPTGAPVNGALMKALVKFSELNRDREPFYEYLRTASSPNQTEVCAIFRVFKMCKPTCDKQLLVCLEVMRFTARHALDQRHPNECKAVHEFFDDTLVQAFTKASKTGMGKDKFLALHQNIVPLVLPKTEYLKLKEHTGQWTELCDEVLKVVSSGDFGVQMFGFATHHVLSDRIASECGRKIKELLDSDTEITAELVQRARSSVVQKIEVYPRLDALPARRQVTINYRGQPIPMAVGNWISEVIIRFTSAVKGQAVAKGVLDPLWCEELVVETPVDGKAAVDRELCLDTKVARETCKEMFSDSHALTGDTVLQTLDIKRKLLLAMDPDFELEIAIMKDACGIGAAKRLQTKILATLPDSKNARTPEQVLALLNALAQGTEHKMAPMETQGQLKCVRTMVSALAEDRQPQIKSVSGNTFLTKVLGEFKYFVSFESSSSANGESEKVFGAEALRKIYGHAKEQHASKLADLSHVSKLRVFEWLVPPEIAAEAESLARELFAAAGKRKK